MVGENMDRKDQIAKKNRELDDKRWDARGRMMDYVESSRRMGKNMKEIKESRQYEMYVEEIAGICAQYETESNFPDNFPKVHFYGPNKNVGFSGDDDRAEN
ncbi:hypothetical protein [Enterococcus raffinosus]|uniref:hypothetical protein n=1 Tax=Enterococcus raffinosus TaxID=71452 RepID=UPI003AC3C0AD